GGEDYHEMRFSALACLCRASQFAEKLGVGTNMRPPGLKPVFDCEGFTRPIRLRSGQAAEAPLFHVTAPRLIVNAVRGWFIKLALVAGAGEGDGLGAAAARVVGV